MPSAATIVQDIVNGSITQFGVYPTSETGSIQLTYDLSKECQLRMGYGYFKCQFEGSKVHFRPTKVAHQLDGTYAEFSQVKSVATIMDHNLKIAVSGFFSGCEWQIYKIKPAVFYCVHVPRSGDQPTEFTDLMAQYAKNAGWQLVAAYESRGAINKDSRETVTFVSQLLPNLRIKTVRCVCSAYTIIAGTPTADAGGDVVSRPAVAQIILPRIVRTEEYEVDASHAG